MLFFVLFSNVLEMIVIISFCEVSRILVTIEDEASIYVYARMFIEDMCYRATNFVVWRNGNGFHSQFHIVLLTTFLVERAWELLPIHSFNLIIASAFASGYL